jgi:hypothetical protein
MTFVESGRVRCSILYEFLYVCYRFTFFHNAGNKEVVGELCAVHIERPEPWDMTEPLSTSFLLSTRIGFTLCSFIRVLV